MKTQRTSNNYTRVKCDKDNDNDVGCEFVSM